MHGRAYALQPIRHAFRCMGQNTRDYMADLLKMTFEDSAKLLFKLVPLLFLGLCVAEIAYRIPAVRMLGNVMKPISSIARLPEYGPVYLTLCLLNPMAATMSLVGFKKRGTISEEAVIVSSLVSGLPVMIYFTFFAIGPVALPMLGLRVTLLYALCLLGTGLFQSLIGIAVGNILLERRESQKFGDSEQIQHLPTVRIVKEAFYSAIKTLRCIIYVLAPILFIVFFLIHSGLMAWIEKIAQPVTTFLDLPAPSIELISTSAMNLIAACGIGGILLSNGTLRSVEVVISLMAGAFIYNLGELLHTTMPYNVSFFGLKLGTKIAITVWLAIGASQIVVIAILIGLRGGA